MKRKVTLLVAVVAISLLMLWGLRWFIRARSESARYSCVTALKSIAGAKDSWALEMGKGANDIPTWDELAKQNGWHGWIWQCPNGGVYTIGRIDEHPTCSIGGLGHSL